MNVPLFILLMVLIGGVSFLLGRRAASESKSSGDFFLMGRKLGPFGLVMTLLATQIGGGALLGASEEAYLRGWAVLFYPLGMVLGMIALGMGYGAKMRKLNLTTVPEIFEKIYESSQLRKIASLLSIVSLYLILASQGIAARKFFISLGLNGDFLFIAFWSMLVCYTVMGGLGAVVKTDILQASFIFIALILAVMTAFPAGGEIQPMETVSIATPWMTWLLMPLFFMLIEQDMGQRCFAAKNPRTVTRAALIAACILMIISLIPILFGTYAAKIGLQIPPGSSVLITSVQALTNPIVATLVICAVLLAISTTADSLLCSVSSNIACDFPILGKSLIASRLVTLAVGLSALLFSYMFDNIVAILMFSYSLAVSILFVPVTMAVWLKKPRKHSAAASMAVGGTTFLIFCFFEAPIPKELLCLASSLATFCFCELRKKEVINSLS